MYNLKIANAEQTLFSELNFASNQIEEGLEVGSEIIKATLIAMDKHSAQYLTIFRQFLQNLYSNEAKLMDLTKREIRMLLKQIDKILHTQKP